MTIAANIGDVAILDFPAYFPDSIVGLIPKEKVLLMFMYYLIPLLSGQKLNKSNWLPFMSHPELLVVCEIKDSIETFSNAVTENTCINV